MKTSVPRMFSSIWNETSVSGKPPQPRLPERTCPRNVGNLLRQLGMRAARKHLQLAEPGRHERITHHR